MPRWSLTPYRSVLSTPGVRSLVVLGVLARIPHTAAGIVLTLHVVESLDRGYAAAGLVTAAVTLGMAAGAPWRGRAVDRLGLRRALLPSVVAELAVWSVAPFVSFRVLLVLAVVGGLLSLPVFTLIRQSLSVLVPQEQRRTAFALDSVFVELSFMVGPALGVLVATQVSTTLALVGVGAAAGIAGIALMVMNPPTRRAQVAGTSEAAEPDDHRADRADAAEVVERVAPAAGADAQAGARRREPAPERAGRMLADLRLLAVLGAAAGATVVLAGTEVSLVASLRETGDVSFIGLVLAAWGLGSLLGGLVYGALPRGLPPLVLLLVLGALTGPVGLVEGPLALCLAILPAGALCAPVITATADAVASLVPDRSLGEAMGWHGSALTIGTAAGAPLAGAAMDATAPWAGFAVVGAAGVVLAALGLAATAYRRRGVPEAAGHPALR